jgi:hypothetical protein
MATRALPPALAAERRFYLSMSIAMLAIVFVGFAPSFYLRGMVPAPAPLHPMSATVLLHGLVFTGWVALFMTQVALVSAGRTDLHRKLGQLGVVMLVAMTVIATVSALQGVARNSAPPGIPPLSWLAVPLFDIPVFVGLIGAALVNRKQAQVHKRFMLTAMIGLLPPSLGRLPLPAAIPPLAFVIAGQIVFLALLALWDVKSRGRVHWVTSVSAVVLIGTWLLRVAIWQTPAWLSFARMVSAPFT